MLTRIARRPTAIIVRGTEWLAFHPVKTGQTTPVPQYFLPEKDKHHA
jgi:hypothetical protein